jgi:hypothetical protein
VGIRRTAISLCALALALPTVLVACGDDSGSSADTTLPTHAIATFQVTEEHGETFKVELTSPELIENAQKLLAGEEAPTIPVGKVVRGDPDGINAPWSWHIDPSTVEFADMTTEVCDGLPSDVEKDLITSPLYCPWGAKLIDLQVS